MNGTPFIISKTSSKTSSS